ncbi:MAG TPA: peptidylprolyl isomerase [Rhodobiaceae bacterium]|nr:peptidylprolyl isomerase [Rhodobiaceae bacterium]|tara:strand:- start:1114 stop:1944 length:831 start_codon:yes stop_codon:yes gene_type:complete
MQFRRTIGNQFLLLALLCAPAFAAHGQEVPANTVASVNGIPITYDDISLAEDELIGLVGQLPERQRFETLIGYMVDRILAAKAARDEGLDSSPEVAKRIDFMKQKALQDVYIGQQLMQRVTEARVEEYFQSNIVSGPKQEEVRARHILLDTREEAEAVIAAIKNGGDFVELAKSRSKGPSGAGGGDLGYFDKDAMVAPFSEAAFKLKKGKISAPVKTQFGWHVIQLEDRRTKPTPPLDEVRDQIFQILISEARREIYDEMRQGADVKFVNIAPSVE